MVFDKIENVVYYGHDNYWFNHESINYLYSTKRKILFRVVNKNNIELNEEWFDKITHLSDNESSKLEMLLSTI